MFTGIITDIGEILSVDTNSGDRAFKIKTNYDTASIDIGASIACSGCCLTAIELGDDWFKVEASTETLSKTALGDWKMGSKVNLERSLRAGDELGGHIVSGHVDALAKILDVKPEGDSHRLKIEIPTGFEKFIAPKGSVALDGISLTVNEVEDTFFGVNIISHTWKVTTLGQKQVGDVLNFEVDLMARYVQRSLEVMAA